MVRLDVITASDFERQLDTNPRDWLCRLVYADWLDEQGETGAAAAQRYMTANEVTPVSDDALDEWGWWAVGPGDAPGHVTYPGHELPNEVFGRLPRPPYYDGLWWKNYADRQAAEAALAAALGKRSR